MTEPAPARLAPGARFGRYEVEVNYPVTVNQTTNGVDWSIETNAIDAWQVERDSGQQWSLGKQMSNKYVGGVSASDALAAVQAVLKYDQTEQSAMRTLNASLLAPVVTPAYAREVQARFDSLRQDGITSVVESLSSAKFCRFTQDSPRAISVSVDEVWSHIAYSRGQVVSQELLEHNPQVTHVALQGTSWLLDGNDAEDLPADFPAACRG